MLSNLHARIPQYIRGHKKDFLAFSIAVAFFIIFSIFSILQYYSLGTSAYDLGINAQSLYAFIHEGVFYSPLLGENTLVQHFSIFKFTEVPDSPVVGNTENDDIPAISNFINPANRRYPYKTAIKIRK